MDESDEVGGGVENSDVLEYAEVMSETDVHVCPLTRRVGGIRIGGVRDKIWDEPKGEIDSPSLQRASNTSVQDSKSLSVVDVVAV